jgi:NADH dehydrogenase FAD-containing subunit
LKLSELDPEVQITLLNKDECFAFTPAIYETAAGELTEAHVCIIIPSMFQ